MNVVTLNWFSGNKQCYFFIMPTNIWKQIPEFVKIYQKGRDRQCSQYSQKRSWDKIGSPITFVYGIIAATVPWIIKEIRRKFIKNKNKNKNIDDYFSK
jgi:hypothetical protein